MQKSTKQIWKFSHIEREVMRCAQEGVEAGFPLDNEGQKRSISADFLADLWMGQIDGHQIHPNGILIKGLRVRGTLKASHNPFRDGYGRLTPFAAYDCDFEASIQAPNANLTSIRFEDCTIGMDVLLEDRTYEVSLRLSNSDISSKVTLFKTKCSAIVGIDESNVGGSVSFQYCALAGTLSVIGSKIQELYVLECEISPQAKVDGEELAFSVMASEIDAEAVWIGRSRISGTVNLMNAQIRALDCQRNKMTLLNDFNISLNLQNSRIGHANFQHNRMSGAIYGSNLITNSDINFGSSSIGSAGLTSCIAFDNAQIGGNFHLFSCILTGGMAINNAKIQGDCALYRCFLGGADLHDNYDRAAFQANASNLSQLRIMSSKILGGVFLNKAVISSDLYFWNCSFLPASSDRKGSNFCFDHSDGTSPSAHISAQGIEAGKQIHFSQCFVSGNLDFVHARSVVISIDRCLIGKLPECASVDLRECTGTASLAIGASVIASGVELSQSIFSSVSFFGTEIYPFEGRTGFDVCLAASNMRCEQDFSISAPASSDWAGTPCHFVGAFLMRSARIGGDVNIQSAKLATTERNKSYGSGAVVVLDGSMIGGRFCIGQAIGQYNEQNSTFSPPELEGAVSLDDVEVKGNIRIHDATISCIGDILRPQALFASEERVSQRKRGVSISMRRAKVHGELVIGDADLRGIFDLRAADIRLLSDRGGDQWTQVGIKPGQLLVDGLTYTDLDETTGPVGSDGIPQPAHSDPAARRLEWLTLQYPDRHPTA